MSEFDKARTDLESVTPGPWRAADGGSFGGWWISLNGDPGNTIIAAVPTKLADAEFIAMARNTFPAMLDAFETAEAADMTCHCISAGDINQLPRQLYKCPTCKFRSLAVRVHDLIENDDRSHDNPRKPYELVTKSGKQPPRPPPPPKSQDKPPSSKSKA